MYLESQGFVYLESQGFVYLESQGFVYLESQGFVYLESDKRQGEHKRPCPQVHVYGQEKFAPTKNL
jgi:hypothetical protein